MRISVSLLRRRPRILNIFSKPDFGEYSVVTPGNVSDRLPVPEHIEKPDYYQTGIPISDRTQVEIKSSKQIQQLRDACKFAANVLQESGRMLEVGMSTNDIDVFVHKSIINKGAYPSPLNYRSFPKSVCTSVNNVACHGIPDDRPLENGDIINVDVTVYLNGYHGDCSRTFLIGNVDEKGRQLVKATEECLTAGISVCRPGVEFSAIGCKIEKMARNQGFYVIPAFLGHGIGSYFHGPPEIMHISNWLPGQMAAGMTFTIEPVLGQGREDIEILSDGWTCITTDGSRTAQAEHTILITEDGSEILTLPDD